jgi:3-oxoacyl-ACP reductase-like protein
MDGTWIMPAADAIVVAMLAAVLWRLRRDPHAGWEERERRLEAIFARLRVLVAQSEGVARDLDGALGAHQRRLRALLDESRTAVEQVATAAADDAAIDGDVIARVRSLAAAAMPVEEIARRVDMPAAEVRVLVGLRDDRRVGRGRASRSRAATAVHA